MRLGKVADALLLQQHTLSSVIIVARARALGFPAPLLRMHMYAMIVSCLVCLYIHTYGALYAEAGERTARVRACVVCVQWSKRSILFFSNRETAAVQCTICTAAHTAAAAAAAPTENLGKLQGYLHRAYRRSTSRGTELFRVWLTATLAVPLVYPP